MSQQLHQAVSGVPSDIRYYFTSPCLGKLCVPGRLQDEEGIIIETR